jgi:rhodanese-related sulfurtransferase
MLESLRNEIVLDRVADIQRVSPEEAKALIDEGYAYVDVRTEAEFEAGHVPGAYNVPVSRKSVPNPDFLAVIATHFAKDSRLIVGCQTGSRSQRAVNLLAEAGYTSLVELRTGFGGSRDAFGRPEPGWSKKGLPIETGSPEGRSYASLTRSAPG